MNRNDITLDDLKDMSGIRERVVEAAIETYEKLLKIKYDDKKPRNKKSVCMWIGSIMESAAKESKYHLIKICVGMNLPEIIRRVASKQITLMVSAVNKDGIPKTKFVAFNKFDRCLATVTVDEMSDLSPNAALEFVIKAVIINTFYSKKWIK